MIPGIKTRDLLECTKDTVCCSPLVHSAARFLPFLQKQFLKEEGMAHCSKTQQQQHQKMQEVK